MENSIEPQNKEKGFFFKPSIWTILFLVSVVGRLLVGAYKDAQKKPEYDYTTVARTAIERYADNNPMKTILFNEYKSPDSTVHHFLYFQAKDSSVANLVGEELYNLGFFESPKKQEVMIETDITKGKFRVKFLVDDDKQTLIKMPLQMTLRTMNLIENNKYRFFICGKDDFANVVDEIK